MSALLFALLKSAAPYAVAMIAGFGLAFGIQELRLIHAEQEFAQYKIDQQVLIQQQIDAANAQRKKVSDDFIQAKAALQKDIDAGNVYRRCVAAGKCGVQRCTPNTDASVPATGELDDSWAVPVSATIGDAALNDCVATTLMLNKLQDSIAGQAGY